MVFWLSDFMRPAGGTAKSRYFTVRRGPDGIASRLKPTDRRSGRRPSSPTTMETNIMGTFIGRAFRRPATALLFALSLGGCAFGPPLVRTQVTTFDTWSTLP